MLLGSDVIYFEVVVGVMVFVLVGWYFEVCVKL